MMTKLSCTVEPPRPLDEAGSEWMSRISYSNNETSAFALTNHNSELKINGNRLECTNIAFKEPFSSIKKELCAQLADHSFEWFNQRCDEMQLYDVVELQKFILMGPSIICIEQDAMYDNTHYENTVPLHVFLELASSIHEIYCMIQAVIYRGTHIFLQIGVSHVRMNSRLFTPSIVHQEDDVLEYHHPKPSKDELAIVHSQIQNMLNRKNHKLCELTTIEKFLQSEFEEKMNRIRKEQKLVSLEIESLKKTH